MILDTGRNFHCFLEILMVRLNLELKFFILGVVFMVLLVALLDLIDLLEDLLDYLQGAIAVVIAMLFVWLFRGQSDVQLAFFVAVLIALLGIWVALQLLKLIFREFLKAVHSKEARKQAYSRLWK